MKALRWVGVKLRTHKHGEEEAAFAVDVVWLAWRLGLTAFLSAGVASAAIVATSSSPRRVPVLQLSVQGAAFVERHEGVRHYPYQDPSGIAACTVGAGHVLAWRYCTAAQMRTFYSDGQIAALLIRDSSIAAACINRLGVSVDQAQFDALVDLTFNAGCGSLNYRGVGYELQHGQLARVPASIRVTATTAGGVYLAGLATRRADEATLFAHRFYGPGIGYYLPPKPPKPLTPAQKRAAAKAAAEAKLREKTGYWSWLAWYLHEGVWRRYPVHAAIVRPHVPASVPAVWWRREHAYLKARSS